MERSSGEDAEQHTAPTFAGGAPSEGGDGATPSRSSDPAGPHSTWEHVGPAAADQTSYVPTDAAQFNQNQILPDIYMRLCSKSKIGF